MALAINFHPVVVVLIVLCSEDYFRLSLCSLGVSAEIIGRPECAKSLDVLRAWMCLTEAVSFHGGFSTLEIKHHYGLLLAHVSAASVAREKSFLFILFYFTLS